MIGVSKNEAGIIDFLIRNYSKRFTIRNIASELKISSAGCHKALKSLEKENLVKHEKLGTGLFYEVNLKFRPAENLAAFVLSQHDWKEASGFNELMDLTRMIILTKKLVFVVSEAHDEQRLREICMETFKEKDIVIETEERFEENVREREGQTIEAIKRGKVLYGERLILKNMKRLVR